jgi:hypothetical protein
MNISSGTLEKSPEITLHRERVRALQPPLWRNLRIEPLEDCAFGKVSQQEGRDQVPMRLRIDRFCPRRIEDHGDFVTTEPKNWTSHR